MAAAERETGESCRKDSRLSLAGFSARHRDTYFVCADSEERPDIDGCRLSAGNGSVESIDVTVAGIDGHNVCVVLGKVCTFLP